MKARQKKQSAFQTYVSVLRAWACDVPADMMTESARDKITDSLLRLFEALDGAGLRIPLQQICPDATARPLAWFPPLLRAMRWQLLALNFSAPLAAEGLSLAAGRWWAVWLADNSAGQAQLMATLDRDIERMQRAFKYISRLCA